MTPVSIAEFESRLIQRYDARGRARKTTNQIKQVLRELVAVGVRATSDLTDSAIERWLIAWPDRTPVTFKSHLRCLSAICTIAKKQGLVDVDPFADEPATAWMRDDARPSPPKRRYSKSPDEIRRVLALAAEEARGGSWEACRLEVLVNLNFLTGARVGELVRLEVSDFDRSAKTIAIHAKWVENSRGHRVWWKPKTVGSAGTIPIGDKMVDLLVVWLVRKRRPHRLVFPHCNWLIPGKTLLCPWTGGGPGCNPLDQVKSLGARAGVLGLTNKAGRKGLGTYKELLTPAERRAHFRHSDEGVGDHYNDEHVESMRPAAIRIERFFFGTC